MFAWGVRSRVPERLSDSLRSLAAMGVIGVLGACCVGFGVDALELGGTAPRAQT